MTSRVLAMTGEYTTASASSAQISSRLFVAFTPIGPMLADLADVHPDLVGAVHPTPDELELRVREHAFDRFFAEQSRLPTERRGKSCDDSVP